MERWSWFATIVLFFLLLFLLALLLLLLCSVAKGKNCFKLGFVCRGVSRFSRLGLIQLAGNRYSHCLVPFG